LQTFALFAKTLPITKIKLQMYVMRDGQRPGVEAALQPPSQPTVELCPCAADGADFWQGLLLVDFAEIRTIREILHEIAQFVPKFARHVPIFAQTLVVQKLMPIFRTVCAKMSLNIANFRTFCKKIRNH
jgi:hypothetical protein